MVLRPVVDFERDRPVFDRTRRSTHPLGRVLGVTSTKTRVELRLDAPLDVWVRVTFCDREVARIQWSVGAPPPDRVTEMLLGPPEELPLDVTETDTGLAVSAGGTPVVLTRDPWTVTFGGYASEPGDMMFFQAVNEPSGFAIDNHDDTLSVYETFRLAPDEELYGLGERYLGPSLRGRRILHWICEPFGVNTTDRVHKSVPLLVSSRGYAVFYQHPEQMTFDLGAVSAASAVVHTQASFSDQFLIAGTPKQVLTRYTALTGRPPELPAWSYRPWYSRAMYRTRAEVEEVVETAASHGLPVAAVHLDPAWLVNGAQDNSFGCDFRWNAEDFGPLDQLVQWLNERDVRLCLWVNPHVHQTSPIYDTEHLVEGGAVRDRDEPKRAFVDFTGAGRDWWVTQVRALVGAGVAALQQLDFAESLPAEARLADGRSGAQVHNVYPLQVAAAAHEAGMAVTFTRAGTAGSQRFPLHWSGDAQSSWAGLSGALCGGLAAAWSGICHWTTDIGGFYCRDPQAATPIFVQPDTELFIRWMQFGMLCSHTRFHGLGPREPWEFGEQALAVAREFSALRTSMTPYLLRCGREAADHGWPLLRPLGLEYPDDLTARHLRHQFLLGPDVLVSPVLAPGGAVDQYVPAGAWRDHFTGERVVGGVWRRLQVPLEQTGLLIREGAEVLT